MKRLIVILFSLACFPYLPILNAQFRTEGYLDIGKTQVSEGLSSQFSGIVTYDKSKWAVQTGCQLGLVQPQNVVFNSWFARSYGKVIIGKIPLDLGVEYLWTAFSPDLRETNWIMFGRIRLIHWKFGLGTNIRTYRLSRKAADDSNLADSDNGITERWNVMYHATYVLKPCENKWNLSASFTNYDHFIIQQENNPMLNLRFDYKLSNPFSLYSELWYKPAGLMVIKVIYYGTLIRLGIIWNI